MTQTSGVLSSTLRDYDRDRISKKERTADKQYLTPQEEENSLVKYTLQLSKNGYSLPIKFLRALAGEIARRRSSTVLIPHPNKNFHPLGKNWPQAFYKRHLDVKAKTLKAIN